MGKRLKKQLKQLICELLLNVLHHETGLVKGPQCATKCGTFDMCATSATNVAQNVA